MKVALVLFGCAIRLKGRRFDADDEAIGHDAPALLRPFILRIKGVGQCAHFRGASLIFTGNSGEDMASKRDSLFTRTQ